LKSKKLCGQADTHTDGPTLLGRLSQPKKGKVKDTVEGGEVKDKGKGVLPHAHTGPSQTYFIYNIQQLTDEFSIISHLSIKFSMHKTGQKFLFWV